MNCSKIAADSLPESARKLFIPGPTWVDWPCRMAMSLDMMGHRSKGFIDLYRQSQPVLRQMAGTLRPVYLATCSSWGMMEAALRNLVPPGGRVLNCCCGAFSDRWHAVARSCGFHADKISVEWGRPIEPEALRQALQAAKYDLVTLVHAETSTGVLNPLRELAWVAAEFEDVLLAVDAVSSYSAVELEMDSWGVDVLLAGVQKALALPPGMAVCAVSKRALERARCIEGRGFYFDFLEYEEQALRSMTISTPAIPLVAGLAYRAQEIEKEGLAGRFERHDACRRHVEDRMRDLGWRPLPPEGRKAPTLNCLLPPAGLDVCSFVEELRKKTGMVIDPGYGKLKGECVRISNMGVTAVNELDGLLASIARLGR